jgi:hypothetical protein
LLAPSHPSREKVIDSFEGPNFRAFWGPQFRLKQESGTYVAINSEFLV